MNTSTHYTGSSSETWLLSRKVLSEAGVEGAVTLIGPGVETPPPDIPLPQPVILFVSDGGVTASVGLSNIILGKDQALHIAEGKTYTLRNHTDAPAKVFTLAVPTRRREVMPLVVEFP
jgi:hypothetical protein